MKRDRGSAALLGCATIVRVAGILLAVEGVERLLARHVPLGIGLLLGGVGLFLAAAYLTERLRFAAWRRTVEENHLDDRIRTSVEDAVKAYRTLPLRTTRRYILTLNPDAGDALRQAGRRNVTQ